MVQIVKPRIRGIIATNSHPTGCEKNVQNHIDSIKAHVTPKPTNLNVLVVGASMGYGLASRTALAWLYGGNTIGVFFDREPSGTRTATAGYYNTVAFHQQAQQDGLFAASIKVWAAIPQERIASSRCSCGRPV